MCHYGEYWGERPCNEQRRGTTGHIPERRLRRQVRIVCEEKARSQSRLILFTVSRCRLRSVRMHCEKISPRFTTAAASAAAAAAAACYSVGISSIPFSPFSLARQRTYCCHEESIFAIDFLPSFVISFASGMKETRKGNGTIACVAEKNMKNWRDKEWWIVLNKICIIFLY